MKNSLSKWGFALVVTAILSITCGVYAADNDQPEGSALSDEVQLLQMRADLAAEEVNDTINDEIKQTEKVKRSRYFEDFHTEPEVNLFTNEELAAFDQQRQEKLKKVKAQLEYEVKALHQNSSAGQNQQTSMMPKSRPQRGMVSGIVIFQKRGAALVDGRIVRENSAIRDIKIVSITKDYVEFEKLGKTWKQMVAQSPPAEFWAEPVVNTSTHNQQPAATKSATTQQPAPAKQTQAKPAPKPANGQKSKVKK